MIGVCVGIPLAICIAAGAAWFGHLAAQLR
jgi:hypothetical protein